MKQTVLGNIKSQPEVLKYTLDNQNVFVDPFVEVFLWIRYFLQCISDRCLLFQTYRRN